MSQANPHLITMQLDILRSAKPFPHYPRNSERLSIPAKDIVRDHLGRIVLPDGRWTLNNHPHGRGRETAPSAQAQKNFIRQGQELDSTGRPVHPWLLRMLGDASIGVVTGKGAYWEWGMRPCVDSAVLHRDHVLLVQRKDTGLWALPGGFIDPGEQALAASKREVEEETRVVVPKNAAHTIAYRGEIIDPRMTAHAWPTTTAYVYKLDADSPRQEPEGRDDAKKALWVPTRALPHPKEFFGGHRFLLDQALRQG